MQIALRVADGLLLTAPLHGKREPARVQTRRSRSRHGTEVKASAMDRRMTVR